MTPERETPVSSARIGIVCGLKSEARAVAAAIQDPRIRVEISGANAERAENHADAMARDGVRILMSIGISGGLLPAYAPGDLVIGKSVATADGTVFPCDVEGLMLLQRSHKATNIAPSLIYGSDTIIRTREEKQTIHKDTGAKSVDMESHAVARVAQTHGIAFLAIRAIADPADRVLPGAALDAVKPDGSTRVFGTLAKAVQNPVELSALMQLGQDSEKALKTLRHNLGGLLGVLLLGSNL